MTPISILFRAIFHRFSSAPQRWFHGVVTYVKRIGVEESDYSFAMEVTEDELLLYRSLYQTYLRWFPNRYTSPAVECCPEVYAAVQQLSRRQ